MLYFIPAWYKQNTWFEQEQIWYTVHGHSEFDDTVKQIQLFHRKTQVPYRIMLLSYAPNLRHFLHRQSIFHAPYWSCFDAIQCVQRKKVTTLSFHDLKWPTGIEFFYTPFCIVARLHGKKYAQIEFGEVGNPIIVDLFDAEKLSRRNIYDDRGFVSSSIIYQDGIPTWHDFYTENGVRKMRLFLEDQHVEIAPDKLFFIMEKDGLQEEVTFQKTVYSSLDEVIREVLMKYVEYCTKEGDLFCEAMDYRHSEMLFAVLPTKRTILSFFEERFCLDDSSYGQEYISSAGYVVVDNKFHLKKLVSGFGTTIENIIDISPFDTREDEGISQQLYVQKIMVPVDHIEMTVLHELIVKLGQYALKNQKVAICFLTRQSEYGRAEFILEMVREKLKEHGLPIEMAMETPKLVAENVDTEEKRIKQCFFAEQCVSELDVSKCMREQRILLDLDREPELYLQVLAVSMGVPQICKVATEFLQPGNNGALLEQIDNLPIVLDYYLKSLKNWNRAHILSYEVGKQYSTDVLLKKWKEVISYFE